MDYKETYQSLVQNSDFDHSCFNQLTEDTDQEVCLKILSRFWITLQESLEQIQEGLKQDNGDLIWKACHKVAGSAELIGYKQFGQQSRTLNAAIKAMKDPQAHANDIQSYLEKGDQIVLQIQTAFPNLRSYL